MTATQMIPAVGAMVDVRCEQMMIRCNILDVKHVWGKARLLVSPVAGNGQQWVELDRVRMMAAPKVTAVTAR